VEHPDLLGLPDAMGSGYGLLLVLGVGVRVVDHHGVSGLQVQAPARRPDAEQEDEGVRVWLVEPLDRLFPAKLGLVRKSLAGLSNHYPFAKPLNEVFHQTAILGSR
jgi:hypothetical protein